MAHDERIVGELRERITPLWRKNVSADTPIQSEDRPTLSGARTATSPLARYRHRGASRPNGVTMVAGQRLRVGRAHAGKTVTILIEDIVFPLLDNDIELSAHARKNQKPVTKLRSFTSGIAISAGTVNHVTAPVSDVLEPLCPRSRGTTHQQGELLAAYGEVQLAIDSRQLRSGARPVLPRPPRTTQSP